MDKAVKKRLDELETAPLDGKCFEFSKFWPVSEDRLTDTGPPRTCTRTLTFPVPDGPRIRLPPLFMFKMSVT